MEMGPMGEKVKSHSLAILDHILSLSRVAPNCILLMGPECIIGCMDGCALEYIILHSPSSRTLPLMF